MTPRGSHVVYRVRGEWENRERDTRLVQAVSLRFYSSREAGDGTRLGEMTRTSLPPGGSAFEANLIVPAGLSGLVETVHVRLTSVNGAAWSETDLALPRPESGALAPREDGAAGARENGRFEIFMLYTLGVIIAGIPFILLGALTSALIDVYASPALLQRIFPERGAKSLLAALGLGLVFPVCECGIVPVARRLMKKGVPARSALVFMLAAPTLNPVTIASTGFAFGFGSHLFWIRMAGAALLALFVGIAVDRIAKGTPLKPGDEPAGGCGCGHDHGAGCRHEAPAIGRASARTRAERLIDRAASEFAEFLFYVTFGSMLAAGLRVFLPSSVQLVVFSGHFLPVLSMMAVAILLSVCSSADAFVAVGFSNLSLGARAVFLLVGPVLDVKLLVMYGAAFRTRVVVSIALLAFVSVAAAGLVLAAAGF